MSDMPTYVLEREFDAPRALVWKAKDIVAEARAKAALNADDAMALAIEETRNYPLNRLP